MSVEALENSMIDAIKLELATIGTPSTAWRTTTPPAIKEGVPGDKIPGPNLCTIYVSHVTSTPGPENAGVSLHQLEGTFQLWCCSSHAADGQRRVLELLADVRDALFGGEPRFTEQFPYGSTFGAYSFSGDEGHIKAGVTVGYLEFRLTGDLPDLEDGMTEAQVKDLIDQYFNKRAMLWNPLTSTPTLIRQSAGLLAVPAQGSLNIITNTPGANKIAEYSLLGQNNDEPFELRGGHVTTFKRRLGCFVGPYLSLQPAIHPSATMYSGIEVGGFDQAPPFPSSPALPIAQLRIVGTPDGRVELLTAKSDGSPAIVRTYDTAPLSPHGLWLEMEIDPVAQTIKAFADGVLLGTTLPADFPDFGNAGPGIHFGLFMTTGSDVLGQPQTWFSMPFHRLIFA